MIQQMVKKHVYKNGLTLLMDEAPSLRSVTIGAWVKTGSRNEDLANWGMCHFLEHMMFKGKKNKGANAIAKAVDKVGGDFNAFTSREHTCFHFYLPAREVNLGASLLKDILYRPLFAAKEIERERRVIMQEIAMVKENPEEESFDVFLEKIYGKHSIGRQILGTEESISKITRASIFSFFYQHYRPENMIISVSGAVSFEKVKKIFSVLDGKWPNRGKPLSYKTEWGTQPPDKVESGFWWMNSSTEQSHIVYGIPAPVKTMKERIVAHMIQQYLGGGMSSIYYDEIREKKGWAYTVYANAVQFLDSSIFTIYAGVHPERTFEVILLLKKEMQKLARKGPSTADLKRIKQNLLNSFYLSLESSESRMMAIANQELFFKKEFSFKEYENMVYSVRTSDLKSLMSEWLKAGDPALLVLSKKPKRGWNKFETEALKTTGKPVIVFKG